jgi:hypothetical protein
MMPCRQPRSVPIPVLLVMLLLVSSRARAVAETPLLVFSTPTTLPVTLSNKKTWPFRFELSDLVGGTGWSRCSGGSDCTRQPSRRRGVEGHTDPVAL